MSLSPLVLAEGPAVNLAHQDLLSGPTILIDRHPSRPVTSKTNFEHTN